MFLPDVKPRRIAETKTGSNKRIKVLSVRFTSYSETLTKRGGEPLNSNEAFHAFEYKEREKSVKRVSQIRKKEKNICLLRSGVKKVRAN